MSKIIYEYTDEQLLDTIRDYYNNVGFPTQRKFNSKNGLPSYVTYYNHFGSFKNAILMAGIPIPPEREKYFNRERLSDEEMLQLLKHYTKEKLKNNIYLLINEDIDNNSSMPSSSAYLTRFGGIINAYKLIGYDYEEFNNMALEKDMIIKLKTLAVKLGRTPSSRDITKYSKLGECYATETYILHFGSIYETQLICNLQPTRIGNNKTQQELLDDLIDLYHKLNRLPTHQDINREDSMASAAKYADEFGSLLEALKMIGMSDKELNMRGYISKNGTVCYSIYEHKFVNMLEERNVKFRKEPLYSEYIENFNRKYRFDFEVLYNSHKYLIEVFGMTTDKDYDERRKEKIQLCKDNNIPLISLYPDIFWSTTQKELFFYLQEKMKEVDEIYYI